MKKVTAVIIVFFFLLAISLIAFYFFAAHKSIPVKIMPLGDSITSGHGSTDLNGYRKKLYETLSDSNLSVDFVGSQNTGDNSSWDKNNEGHFGWSANGSLWGGNILDNISRWLDYADPDIILLQIGTNDITQNDVVAYEDVEKILDKIRSHNNKTIILLALIINRCYDFPEHASWYKKEDFENVSYPTRRFNENLNEMALKRADYNKTLFLVDMYRLLNCSDDYFDVIHPNDKGYSKMADAWFEALMKNYNFSSRNSNY